MMPNAKDIASAIRRLHKKRGVTQDVFSGFAGIDNSHMSKIERGIKTPSIHTLFKIAAALEIGADELMREIMEESARNHPEA